MTQKTTPTLTWDLYRNQRTASARIGNGKKAVYMIYYIDFGYGDCYRCLRSIVDEDTDVDDVDFNDGIEVASYIHTAEEAEEACQDDLQKLIENKL